MTLQVKETLSFVGIHNQFQLLVTKLMMASGQLKAPPVFVEDDINTVFHGKMTQQYMRCSLIWKRKSRGQRCILR